MESYRLSAVASATGLKPKDHPRVPFPSVRNNADDWVFTALVTTDDGHGNKFKHVRFTNYLIGPKFLKDLWQPPKDCNNNKKQRRSAPRVKPPTNPRPLAR